MRSFVRDYYELVTEDPETTWPQLTPEYQAETGGFDDYTAYWSTIAEARARSLRADPAGLTVTFDLRSERTDGSEVDEVLTLLLERTEDGYLIAGQQS